MCYDRPQYSRCSSNTECTCFLIPDTVDTGICGFEWILCSKLAPCESRNNHCNKSNHICINHPRCQNFPVCYPISLTDKQICPSIPCKAYTSTCANSIRYFVKSYRF